MSKIGFWSVLSLVVGSQIGSGVFMSPVSLAPYGTWAFLGWGIAGIGAVLLALVFGQLSMRVSRTGGPHTFIEQAFGRRAAFFMAWTYWVISWVSTPAVLIAAIGYLSPLIGISDPMVTLALELGLLALITGVNFLGARTAGRAEFILSLLKILPLLVIPLLGLWIFQADHLAPMENTTSGMLPEIVALTFWGFIGIETATAAAGAVRNPSKTIPRAILVGTTLVALLYMLNSMGVMGLMPFTQLATSSAPYADAAKLLLGAGWDRVVAMMAFLACVGTLNAWVLTSGQIAAGAAQDGLFPKAFASLNKRGAPFLSLLISALGVIPMLLFTLDGGLGAQLNWIIDLSVTAFLFVYGGCVLAFFKLLSREPGGISLKNKLLGGAAILFCAGMIAWTAPAMVGLSLLFTASGIPVYLWMQKRSTAHTEIPRELVTEECPESF